MTIDTKLEGLIAIIVCAGIGAVFYGYLLHYDWGLLKNYLERDLHALRKKLGFRRIKCD